MLRSVALSTGPNLTQFNGSFSLHQWLSALVWMNTGTFRPSKIYLEVPKDSAFILSKSRSDRC